MPDRRDDGGPAFPRPHSTTDHANQCEVDYAEPGMTLRDWYKGQALVGALLSGRCVGLAPDELAKDCGNMADAMLRERAKGGDRRRSVID